MLLLDSQVHHDTHVLPMGNYVIEVGNYVIVSPSELGNYMSADTPGSARRRGIAPPAVRAVTNWVFAACAGTSLREIMLVDNDDNPASCRVAEKAGYPFLKLSPANPRRWYEDGHIHLRRTSISTSELLTSIK